MAVPGAGPSSGASEGCPCDLIFMSADLNIAITTLKHLPLLESTSWKGCELVGSARPVRQKSIIRMDGYTIEAYPFVEIYLSLGDTYLIKQVIDHQNEQPHQQTKPVGILLE